MNERSLVTKEGIVSQEKQMTCFERRDETLPISSFVQTKPYKSFVEFCETSRRFRYVGICHGLPGVGKTIAARMLADWDAIEPLLTRTGVRQPVQGAMRSYPGVALYTPGPRVAQRGCETQGKRGEGVAKGKRKVSL